MEIILGLTIAFLVLITFVFSINLSENRKAIESVKKEVLGEPLSDGSFYTHLSLRYEVKNVERRNKVLERVLQNVLFRLPDLYKEEIELYKKVNFPNNSHCLMIDTEHRRGLCVSFQEAVSPIPIEEILREARDIKNIQEKCCPKKGKK